MTLPGIEVCMADILSLGETKPLQEPSSCFPFVGYESWVKKRLGILDQDEQYHVCNRGVVLNFCRGLPHPSDVFFVTYRLLRDWHNNVILIEEICFEFP